MHGLCQLAGEYIYNFIDIFMLRHTYFCVRWTGLQNHMFKPDLWVWSVTHTSDRDQITSHKIKIMNVWVVYSWYKKIETESCQLTKSELFFNYNFDASPSISCPVLRFWVVSVFWLPYRYQYCQSVFMSVKLELSSGRSFWDLLQFFKLSSQVFFPQWL